MQPQKTQSCLGLAVALSVAVLCLSVLTGCGAKAKSATESSPKAVAGKPNWSWDNYPPVTKMRLGVLPCQLLPKSAISINSPLMGILHLYVNNPQTNLPAGYLWGEFEPKIFALEAKQLEEAEKRLNEREKVQIEVEIPRQKLQLERQIEETQRQVAMLRMLSTNKELADLTFNITADSGSPLRPDSLSKSETELSLMQQSLSYLRETNLTLLGIDLTAPKTDLEKRRLDFERRRVNATFKMPFAGRLTLSIPITPEVSEYPVNVGTELAVARDLSAIRVRTAIANVSWTALAPETLKAVIRLPTGQELQAPFAYQKIEKFQNREESVYYFQLSAENAETAARLIGTDVSCELWVDLAQPMRVVPKFALVLHEPNAFQGRTWINGLASSFPGAQLLVEGQTDLALVVPQENRQFKK